MKIRKIILFILFVSFACFQAVSFAQEYKDNEERAYNEDVTSEPVNKPLPGMEVRKIGGINMMVPEGSRVYKQGATLILEDDGGYAARRLKDMNDRFFKMEEKQKYLEERYKKLEEEIKELRKAVEESRKNS